ncbi:hypothetical protein LUZ61_000795 [Rhynchospora tenuis]|uniref:Disease resistance protein At4g27190-like leucine-rich repeats domain-containing protein n=1 Tax=Rhynchospora tenuis TaxID=198213 RepID=A0AAD6EQD5_9POAL|nr:hypothetical protein LUZ61_000795 [Rhynchospora tenuis]
MIEWPQNIAPEDLLPILSELNFDSCHNLKYVSWTLYLPCLRELNLFSCGNIVQLIENVGGSSGTTKPTFPSLVELSLRNLPEMQIICDQSITFPSLEKLWILECPNLKKLPFQSPGKLKIIQTERECWERLEWEDNDLKQELQPLVQNPPPDVCSIM